MPRQARNLPPLDRATLERMALRYVERFATTRARLERYLRRKIAERGWEGEAADPAGLADAMVSRGYVDDRAYADAKARSMHGRGLGARRVGDALWAAGVAEGDRAAVAEENAPNAAIAALAFARRRRIGPFAEIPADRPLRDKHLAAMLRAGHDITLSRQIVRMAPGEEIDELIAGND
ncbi:regulatory protein RecX [Sphingomonas sp. GlSt437]|uniref:regulatory protein RecX n=1 Tax=Sphingomonas sp. GlSt437 TaxID=3389970 RepID=UPI003A887CF6